MFVFCWKKLQKKNQRPSACFHLDHRIRIIYNHKNSMIIYKKIKRGKNSSISHMLSLICKLVVNHTHFVHYFRCYSVLAVFYYHCIILIILIRLFISQLCLYLCCPTQRKTVLAHFFANYESKSVFIPQLCFIAE